MVYNTFILDIYNIFYRAAFSSEDQVVRYGNEEFHVNGIIRFFEMLESYIKKYSDGNPLIYFCFDNAKTSIQKYRKALSEDYKKTRIEQPSWFYKALDTLELILRNYRDNSSMFRIKFVEADDYIASLTKYYIKNTDNVLLISEDSDWSRGLDDNIHQLAKGKIYTKELFFEENGYEATYKNICFWKSCMGDSADCIIGAISQLPKSYFLEIIKKANDMNEFIQKVNTYDFLDLGWIERIKKEEQNLMLNWNLVTSIEFSKIDLDAHKIKCSFNETKLRIIYSSLDLLGKFDARVKDDRKFDDSFNVLLDGMQIERK